MQKKNMLAATLIVVCYSVGFGTAFGQEENPEPQFQMLYAMAAMGSFLVAGVFYSSSGWIKKVRRKLAGEEVPIDWNKMGKSVAIGVLLGIGAIIWSAWNGDVIQVTNAQEFFVQVGLNTATILLVDKWILGRGTEEKAGPTGDNDDEFAELWDEIPVEVPPGKGDLGVETLTNLGNQDPNKMMFLADKNTWNENNKTINGQLVRHVATQASRRTRRKKKDIHVYHIEGSNLIVFNQSRYGPRFMRIAIRLEVVQKFYETFVKEPLTDAEKEWLSLYGYVLDN